MSLMESHGAFSICPVAASQAQVMLSSAVGCLFVMQFKKGMYNFLLFVVDGHVLLRYCLALAV